MERAILVPSWIKITLIGLLILAAGLRLWDLAGPDMIQDDVLYSMRAIGYVDYVASDNTQTTPVIWFATAPWWQHLSFHDHPPLVFLIQWLFFQLLGVGVWAARLPFFICGALSVLVIFFLGRRSFNPVVGLGAAAFLTIANYAIWISRIGYLDGFLVLWISLALYLFYLARRQSAWYWGWGVALAAGFLTKYTFACILPVFLVDLIIFRRSEWRRPSIYLAGLISFVLCLPVVIYNVMLWQSRGHLDLALSAILGQHPADYKIITYAVARGHWLSGPLWAWIGMFSLPMLILILSSLILVIRRSWVYWRQRESEETFLMVATFLATGAMFFLVGGGTRFGVMTLPAAAWLVGWLANELANYRGRWRQLFWGLFGLALIWELFFATQSQLLAKPLSTSPLFLAQTRPDRGGYRYLDDYVGKFLAEHPGKPVSIPHGKIPQLAAYVRGRAQAIYDEHPNWQPNRTLLVFDEHLEWFASTWIFERRALYDVAPVHPLNTFLEQLQAGGEKFYQQFGFQMVRVIVPTAQVPQNPEPGTSPTASFFLTALKNKYRPIEIIRNQQGVALFEVYQIPFNLK